MRKRPFPCRKHVWLLCLGMLSLHSLFSQQTFPVNGVAEPRTGSYAFTNATIVQNGKPALRNATLVIRDGKIAAVGADLSIPKDATVVDCSGKFIYPSFIDAYSDYGIAVPQRAGGGFNFGGPAQFTSAQKGAFGWNQAIRSDVDGSKLFVTDDIKARPLREAGFGTVLTHQKDGIARGTGVVVTLANAKENLVIIKERASAHYSFNKGVSAQSYPSSMMGSVALLRQTYIDAQWYKGNPATEGANLTLKAFNDAQSLPQIFEANDKWTDIRADRVGDEFSVQYVIKGGGNEYQRIPEIAATKANYILSLNFPQAMDVEDPNDARMVSLADMKHWELAPTNAAALEKAGIPFVLTAAELRDPKQFLANLRKSIEYGLSEERALDALTKAPATLLGIYDKVGSIDAGKLANFIITSGPVFNEKTVVLQNWIQGGKYTINDAAWSSIAGTYNLVINSSAGAATYTLDVKSGTVASVIGKDTLTTRFTHDGKMVKMYISTTPQRRMPPGGQTPGGFAGGGRPGTTPATIRLTGVSNGNLWQGLGEDTAGNKLTWSATLVKPATEKSDSSRRKPAPRVGKVSYPFTGYGWEELPKQETILIKNATVWTSDKEGKLEGTDVLVKGGKIVQVGKGLTDAAARVIDGTGKHLTAGIIDEHSHIAAFSINEGAESVTSEVRIADNLNPDDINIYRQLSGGVTSSHILHGSANTIGGQTQLIKLRWGANDEELKFKNWDPFIKFALGENVKRTTATQGNNRFPDTRMGVEEVLMDAFQRATDYQNAIKKATDDAAKAKKGTAAAGVWTVVKKDLELEALKDIMNKKMFITCHSYVQTEITYTMRVAEKFGFTVNTFTHILEGYKVADKMKAHGATASTFSDWWAYKTEVQDAIAQNASIMHRVGLNVCINSDDAEMARRLNQEAAKSVKYGGMSEEDALKMVTINPAIALHVSDRVGSIRAGKEADLVLWSDNPLSIYAKAEKTIVDGVVQFDRERDLTLRKKIAEERNRLVQKMLGEKRTGAAMGPATPSFQLLLSCGDHAHNHGLLDVDADEESNGKN